VVLVLAAAGCDSGGQKGPGAEQQAKQFSCPPARAVSAALGKTVPFTHRGTVALSSVTCSYVDTKAGGATVIVSVTFGVGRDQLEQIAKVAADGRAVTPLAGIGDVAFHASADANNGPVVFAHSGNRAVSVVQGHNAGTEATTAAVSRLFL